MFTRFLYVLILSFSYLSSQGQSFRFDYYGVADGISEDFAYSIVQDDNGYLLVSTDEGIYKFNGFNFERIYSEDDKTKFVSSYKAIDGTIWFGKSSGGVLKYSEGKFESIPLLKKVDVDEEQTKVSRVTDFFEHQEAIWIATQKSGIFRIDNSNSVTKYVKGIEDFNIYSFAKTKHGFLIGTDMGLYQSSLEGDSIISKEVEDIFYSNINCITTANSSYLIGTESLGAFNLTIDRENKINIMPIKMGENDLSKFHINHIFNDGNNSVWVSTNKKGLLQLCMNEEEVCHEMIMYSQGGLKEVKTVKECFIDRERNVWIASIDEGVVSLRNDFFSFYQLNNISPDRVVYTLAKAENNSFWIGTENRVMRCSVSPWRVEEEYSVNEGLPLTEYSSLVIDEEETIWVGSIDKGLFYKRKEETRFTSLKFPLEYQDKTIYHLSIYNSKIYISTDFGLIEVEDYKFNRIYSMKNGLPHNKIATTFPNGERLMVATRANEISFLQGDSVYIEKIPITRDYRDSGMMQYVTDETGKLWVSTSGAGISSVEGDQSLMLTEADGLMSNFVHSMLCDSDNQLWMTHRGGLGKYNIADSVFTTYDPVEGRKIDFSNNASLIDDAGRLWFGTNRGLIRYRSDLDFANGQSPIVNIIKVEVNRERAYYSEEEKIEIDYNLKDFSLNEEKKYDIKVQFEGVSLKNPSGVVYYYKIVDKKTAIKDEIDSKDLASWTKTSDRETVQIKVSAGDYLFKIMAFNADGIGGDEITTIEISIDKPFWEKKEFWLFLAIILFAVFFTVIKIREKRFKKTQAYLKKELDIRTKEVVSQKEVLEIINTDLTDSIEYAKNIQTAILPAPQTLPSIFGGAFVFYKPRDIVSGDFYWVEQNGDIVTMAVADCTGHGVPGAFMSLIGSALLKDIRSREEVTSPEILMIHLDLELKEMLNKKDSRFGVHDGMDITVLEFDLSTNKLRVCSGKRPVVLYIDGERITMKGDRASVGGYGETIDKNFTVTEFQLSKGDRFYMYSDGIVDQFGGERGKKLKNRAFVSYLDEIQKMPIEDQQLHMKKFFDDWMGELAQIDDVIVVGIEV